MKRRKEVKTKRIIQGDDAIESSEADWFNFEAPAKALAEQLFSASKTSGICCGIVGPWGSGKSSYMKLMDEYLNKTHLHEVCTVWFKAWDPGGIDNLGDAMLYRLFHDIAGKHKDLDGAFKRLQEALGVRKSVRERTRQALGVVSKALPELGRVAVDAVGSLIDEYDVPRKVDESFNELMKWLEEKDRTIFLFIDDIDRTTGGQIRDLLSELKVYISHRRIVAVLGYDGDYIPKALKTPILPEGIDPEKYIEKIVTIRQSLPKPEFDQIVSYAAALIKSTLGIDDEKSLRLAYSAARLSLFNPRKMKDLVLTYSSSLRSKNYKDIPSEVLVSGLISCKAAELSLLQNQTLVAAFESGNESQIIATLQEHIKEDSSKKEEIQALINVVEGLKPEFTGGILSSLRLWTAPRRTTQGQERQAPPSRFDWGEVLFPILSDAALHGFGLTSTVVVSSESVTVPPSTEVESLTLDDLEQFQSIDRIRTIRGISAIELCVLKWDEYIMIATSTSRIIKTVKLAPDPRHTVISIMNFFLNVAPEAAAKKDFILWIIDDEGCVSEHNWKSWIESAHQKSKGLKHRFIFQLTPSSAVKALLEFLLRARSKSDTSVR